MPGKWPMDGLVEYVLVEIRGGFGLVYEEREPVYFIYCDNSAVNFSASRTDRAKDTILLP